MKIQNVADVSSLCLLPVIAVVTIKFKTAKVISETKYFVHKRHETDTKRELSDTLFTNLDPIHNLTYF